MTRFSEEQYKCSGCGRLVTFRCYQEINVTQNPEMKDDVVRGKIFEDTCSQCGKVNYIPYPLLYIDENQNLLIFLNAEDIRENPLKPVQDFLQEQKDDESAALLEKIDSYTVRIVKNPNELSEKIQIFDHNRDDRILEMMKVLMRGEIGRKAPDLKVQAMYYTPDAARKNDRFSIETDKGFGSAVDVYEDLYQGIEKEVIPQLTKDEREAVRIDEDWAFRAMGFQEKKEQKRS